MSESIVKRTASELVEDVYVSTLIDASQSMSGVWAATIQAYHVVVRDRRDDAAVRYSGAMFNTEYFPFAAVATSHDAHALALNERRPDGGTALHDAILERIADIDGSAVPPSEVLFAVFSDGDDNSSQATLNDVRAAVLRKRALGWRFVFFAPGEELRAKAVSMGFEPENTVSYLGNEKGVTEAFCRLSRAARRFIASAEMGALPPAKLVDD